MVEIVGTVSIGDGMFGDEGTDVDVCIKCDDMVVAGAAVEAIEVAEFFGCDMGDCVCHLLDGGVRVVGDDLEDECAYDVEVG